MFKKLNTKTLVIILVILVAIYFLADYLGNRERSFRSTVVDVDTTRVTDIYIHMPKEAMDVHLNKTAPGEWQVSAGADAFAADQNVVKNILGQFAEMKPKRVAAVSSDRWEQYEVSDSTATRVVLKNEDNELADLYIGKFSYSQSEQAQAQNPYQQQRGTMTSFVRLADEDKVFAVDGFLKMSYQKDINSYRNKSLVNVNKDDISRVVFDYPVQDFTLSREQEKWMLDGMAADSAKMVKYLNTIARLNSSSFVDPSTSKTGDATHVVRIEGNNFSPVELKAFPTSDTLINYVVTSSKNPGAEFDGSKAQLYDKVFVSQSELLPDGE
ncbi:MAG: DUF4340 domain-containing protein [Bacteroidales bacterium]